VYGDAVNLASRMESNAPVDSVMIPEYTMNLVKGSFLFKDNGDILVKGKEKPISVYLVESKKDKKVSHVSPFVGRDDDMGKIESLYNKCNKSIKNSMTEKLMFLGVSAAAGIGKSRLVYEFLDRTIGLDMDLYSSGSCSNISSQPYNLFISLIKDSFGISILDNSNTTREKLESGINYLNSLNPNKEVQLNEAKVFLGLLLGIKYEDERLNDKNEMMNHIRISIRIFIECLCRKANNKNSAFIIVLEDLHWIDNMSLETIEYLIQTFNIQDKRDKNSIAVPLFIATYRKEFKVSSLIELECNFKNILLNPLEKKSAFELIKVLTKDIILGESKISELYVKSNGNPFFIEEWVSLIKEKDISETIDRSRELVDEYSIPNTLNSLILSRVDSLEKDLKLLLQKATIIGEEFFLKILSLLENKLGFKNDIQQPVDNLETEDFIQHYMKQIDQYKFKHILTRDVAYSTILKSNRKILHKSVANVIEENFPDIIEKFYYDLAIHYDHAEEYLLAINYLEKSGNQFKNLIDMKNALQCFNRAIKIIESEKIDLDTRYYRICNEIGDINTYLGNTNKAVEDFNKLLKDSKLIDKNLLIQVYHNLGNAYGDIGENKLALDQYEKSISLAKDLNNDDMLAKNDRVKGVIMMSLGDFDKSLVLYKQHMKHFIKSNNQYELGIVSGNIGSIYLYQGQLDKACKFFEKQVEICKKIDSKQLLQLGLGNIALIENIKGKYESAIAKFDEILMICQDINDQISISNTIGNIGIGYKNIGEYDKAIKQYEMQLEIAKKSNYKKHICSANTNLGVVYYNKGDFDQANIHYDKSEELINDIDDKNEKSMLYGNKGILYVAIGEFNKALIQYNKSQEIFSSLDNIRGESLVSFEKSKILYYQKKYAESHEQISKSFKIFKQIGDLPNYSKSLILSSKIKREMKDLDSALIDINKGYDAACKINSDDLINESSIEKEIIEMYRSGDSDKILALTVSKDSDFSETNIAYIHFNLWKYANIESSKSIALKLYKHLYKNSPTYLYKNYIDLLS
jgi:predicted ATPase